MRTFLTAFQPAAALTFAISFLLTIYAPLELYFTNIEEFHFSFSLLFPELIKLFLLVMAAGLFCFGFCYVLYVKLYDVALAAATIAFLCTYLQGMFLAGSLPPLDGTRINWGEYALQNLQSLVLWFVAGIAVVLLIRFLHMKRMYRVFTGIALFLSSVLLVTLVVVGIQSRSSAPDSDAVITKNCEFDMSTEQNLVIFVVDAVDSATFQQLLQSEDSQFRKVLENFTYYPNTVGSYPFTKHAIPFLLNGKWYENQEDFRAFTTQAMDESPLLQELRARNYRMGVYEEELIYENDNVYDFENVTRAEYQFSSFRSLVKAELKLVWFKYAPFPVKRLARVNVEDFSRLLVLDNDEALFHANNTDFYQDVENAVITTTDDKCFRFIHIEGAHVPFRYDRDVNLIDEAQGSYPQNIECSMTIVRRYLEQLKAAGVYDSSAIVILADHGYGYNQEIPIVGRGNPLLAVKGINEHHDFISSDAPISYEDLQEAYRRLLDGASGDQVFDVREGDIRPRRFLCYLYEKDAYMVEYEQTGHASDVSTMLPTGAEYYADRPPHHGSKDDGPRDDGPRDGGSKGSSSSPAPSK